MRTCRLAPSPFSTQQPKTSPLERARLEITDVDVNPRVRPNDHLHCRDRCVRARRGVGACVFVVKRVMGCKVGTTGVQLQGCIQRMRAMRRVATIIAIIERLAVSEDLRRAQHRTVSGMRNDGGQWQRA